MNFRTLFILGGLLSCTLAQTLTLSACHEHDGREYCLLPDGSEVPFTRTKLSTSPTPATAPATTKAVATHAPVPESVTDCHVHDGVQFCMASGTHYKVLQPPAIDPLPDSYHGCHEHGAGKIYCMAPDGTEVSIVAEGTETEEHTEATEHAHTTGKKGQNCHYHGNVLHCTGGDEPLNCEPVDYNYNTGLRIGLVFVILVSSAFAVYAPLLLERFTKMKLNGIVFTILKQFGTGVILSTGFVHLLAHAEMQFANECLGPLSYHAVATAIALAGVFISFLIEYIGNRLIANRSKPADPEQVSSSESVASKDDTFGVSPPDTSIAALGHSHSHGLNPDTPFSIAVMEAGIVFHSILIGVTLSVTPNSFYTTFFVVILFHQMFEGLALGTRIAALRSSSFKNKCLMASVFALITPVGMVIGIAALQSFNGNDPKTIVALGTLDAISAGILLWVGLVEMLAHDWMWGDMAEVGWSKGLIGGASLVTGMALMSLIGKWA